MPPPGDTRGTLLHAAAWRDDFHARSCAEIPAVERLGLSARAWPAFLLDGPG
ncbi:MAG: hypothetical protein AB1806_14120 [Acidobacteriota bacterium]